MAALNARKRGGLGRTHEGGIAVLFQDPLQELRRTVFACLLWEDTFYESGGEIAERIKSLCTRVDPRAVAELAVYARQTLGLRHVPLLLARQLARLAKGNIVSDTIEQVICRADELTEFLAIYWSDNGKKTLSAQVKKGLSKAFRKFDAYQLAKYNRRRGKSVWLRDVLFLCHAKPGDERQEKVWRDLANDTLDPPDTWEVLFSSGADKKETFEKLLRDNKLGPLALLRNLRLMSEVGVDCELIFDAIERSDFSGIFPSQFLAAWLCTKETSLGGERLEELLLRAMVHALGAVRKLQGNTVIVVDVSGSMFDRLSARSVMKRVHAAAALAILLIAACEGSTRLFTYSNDLVEIFENLSPRFSLVSDIIRSQRHGGTYLGRCLLRLRDFLRSGDADRIVVITDEQAHDGLVSMDCVNHRYLVNIGPYRPALDTGSKWVRINGFSERLVDFMYLHEQESAY